MSIGWFAKIGADFKWRVEGGSGQLAFLLPSGSTQQTTDPGAWSGALQAERRAV
jgi:hypothetical protein